MTERRFLVRHNMGEMFTALELHEGLRISINIGGEHFEAESLKELGRKIGTKVPRAEYVLRFPEFRNERLLEQMKLEFMEGVGTGLAEHLTEASDS